MTLTLNVQWESLLTNRGLVSLLQVKNVFEQEGFSRQKRGYRNINDIEVNMSDPLFTKQWYLVSNWPGSCLQAT